MERSTTWLLVIVGAFAVAVLGAGCWSMSVYGHCSAAENGLEAQYEQDKNNYSNYFSSLKETAQVPAMYTADVERVFKGAIAGRYGDGGSKAVFQAIQEHNPNLDSKLYVQIQRIIEAGRKDFEMNQKALIDKRREYKDFLVTPPSSVLAGLMGFPKADLKKYDAVTNDETEDAFRTKRAAPISITGK